MKQHPLYIQILIRLAFLIVPLLGLYLLMVFTYDPHKLCDGDYHRHTMGPVGYVLMGGFICVIWFIAMIIEIIWRYFNSDKKVLSLLIFLLAIGFLAVMFFI
ncbi:hypothetical protein [Pedobacter xixiisoli]|uniref:Uncharacterized protein n=1 Tax=Pedobacter xixiisoli TaxID=1476464 RepID=A0A285ZUN4_9SPHI|nr:hypothetical protein [Pedobacter xixiisoli]SOD13342.1 hypothetical protein SAMN06297358_1169 [Pedobacter xixiisoli]